MSFSTVFPGFLLTIASVSTVSVCLACISTLLLRKSSAALRHFLWLLALFVPLFALPFAGMNHRVAIPLLPSSLAHFAPLPSAQPASTGLTASPGSHQVAVVQNSAASSKSGPGRSLTMNLWLVGWLLGSAVFLVRQLLSHAKLRRLIHESGHPASTSLLDSLDETSRRLQIRRPVRLMVIPFVEVPFCHGVFRPSVILPESANRWPDEQVAICLTHELAHLRRGDLLALLVGQFACLLCWFNPLIWFATAKLREEAEKSADDLVLAGNISPEIYASNLVAMAEKYQASLFASRAILTMARPNRLKCRIEAILDSTLRRQSPGLPVTMALSLFCLGLLASAMAVELTAAAPAPSPGPDSDLTQLDPTLRDGIWETASRAIKDGDIKTVDSLLKRGLDVNVDLVSNCSLLYLAVDDNQLPIVKLLLAKGADVNQKTSWGDTPIKRACWRGHKEIADALIAAGAPVDALRYATGMGDVAALEALEKKQPLTPKQARNALNFAVASGYQNTFEWLWNKLGPMDEVQKEKLLGNLYENAGKWGQAGILRHLETLGATPAKFGSRALANAVCQNFPEVVKYLLDQGVSPDVSAPGWGNMLRDSAGEGHLEIVKLLLDHNANPNVRDSQGLTPLSWAAYSGKEDVCLLLLKHGANVNIEDDFGENAAWKAAGAVHCPDTLELLIKKGVKLTGQNKHGLTIFHSMMYFAPPSPGKIGFPGKIYTAQEMRDYDQRERRTVDLLVAAGVDFNGHPGARTPLMAALEVGHFAAARALMAHGADLSITDREGNPALVYLFNYPRDHRPLPLDILEDMLKAGSNPNPEIKISSKPPMAFPLLEEAIGYASNPSTDAGSFRQAIKILLDHGATFPTGGNDKTQALLAAAAQGDLPALQQEITRGTSVDAADDNGWNALIIAMSLGYDDCSEWLLAQGANVVTRTRQSSYSPLGIAIQRGQTALVDTLIAKGARPDSGDGGIYCAVEQNNQPLFDALIKSGADVKGGGVCTITSNGATFRLAESIPLFLCIRNGNPAMAQTLLDKGADPDPANLRDNRNLVYWAVHYNQPEILKALLAHGANPSVKDTEGETPLLLAQKSHKELVPILKQALNNAKR